MPSSGAGKGGSPPAASGTLLLSNPMQPATEHPDAVSGLVVPAYVLGYFRSYLALLDNNGTTTSPEPAKSRESILSRIMAATSGNTGWAQLRQQARNLETQVRALRHFPCAAWTELN